MKPAGPRKTPFYFCFNPDCPDCPDPSLTRVFLPSSQGSQEHRAVCKKWIACPQQLRDLANMGQSIHQSREREEVNLDSEPLEAMIDFSKRKKVIRQSLILLFETAKLEMCNYIDSYKTEKLRQLDNISYDIEKYQGMVEEIKMHFDKETNKDANFLKEMSRLITKKLNLLPSFDLPDVFLFSKSELKKEFPKVKKAVGDLFDTLIAEKRLEGQLETVKYSDMSMGEQFLKKKEITGQVKLSQLCSWQQSDYLVADGFQVSLHCPLCTYSQHFDKKEVNITDQVELLCRHVSKLHKPFVGLCYSQKLKEKEPQMVEIDYLKYLMRTQTFRQLVIIDGSNVKSFSLEINPSKLYVAFTPMKPTKDQKECFWMQVQNAQEAAFFTILLIQEICVCLQKNLRTIGFKRQHYTLFMRVIDLLRLQGKVTIEEKFKPANIVKNMAIVHSLKN